jgi:hypothetical protein
VSTHSSQLKCSFLQEDLLDFHLCPNEGIGSSCMPACVELLVLAHVNTLTLFTNLFLLINYDLLAHLIPSPLTHALSLPDYFILMVFSLGCNLRTTIFSWSHCGVLSWRVPWAIDLPVSKPLPLQCFLRKVLFHEQDAEEGKFHSFILC